MKNYLAILAVSIGTALAALLPADAQVANGKVTTAAPTYTNGNISPLSLDTAGNLRTVTGTAASAQQVQGNVAHDAANVGNPVGIGGFGNSTAPAAVTDGDRVNAWYSTNGAPIVAGLTGTPADNSANTSTFMPTAGSSTGRAIATYPFVFDGSTWDMLRGTSAGGVSASVITALPAGTNNIGDVDVLTLPNVTIGAALPAGTNNIGDVGDAQGAATAGQIGPIVQGAVTTAAPTYTTGNSNPISLQTNGALRVQEAPVAMTSSSFAGTTSPSVIKASAGILYGVGSNTVATAVHIDYYDNASACSGTVRYKLSMATATNNVVFPIPIAFANGITACTNAGTANGYATFN